jgi:hypothetical protein
MDRAHGSVGHGRTAVYGSMVDHGQRRGRSSSEEGTSAFLCMGPRHGGSGSKRRRWGSSPRSLMGGAVMEGGRRRG